MRCRRTCVTAYFTLIHFTLRLPSLDIHHPVILLHPPPSLLRREARKKRYLAYTHRCSKVETQVWAAQPTQLYLYPKYQPTRRSSLQRLTGGRCLSDRITFGCVARQLLATARLSTPVSHTVSVGYLRLIPPAWPWLAPMTLEVKCAPHSFTPSVGSIHPSISRLVTSLVPLASFSISFLS